MLDWFSELLEKFGSMIIKVLPTSPVQKFLGNFDEIPALQYLNWFLPISSILVVMEIWLSAVALFYIYSLILRWIRAIS